MSGCILVNGNVARETDLIHEHRERILNSQHRDPEIREARKVLLVTAAWGAREYDESHVKRALHEIGLEPRYDTGGFDVARQNLGLHHATQHLFASVPAVESRWRERERVARSAREYYLATTRAAVGRFRAALRHATKLEPRLRVAELLDPRARMASGVLHGFLRAQLADDLHQIQLADDRLLSMLGELDAQFVRDSGLYFDAVWRELRAQLESRILTSTGIFLFGGDPTVLMEGLRLFALADVFAEALRRGTSLYTVSAGSLVLCDRMIVYHQHEGAEFELLDRGLGLVRDVQLFPHCMERVQTDDADNLAYLAFRFHQRACAGLNEGSYLLLQTQDDGRLLAQSVGQTDGVYVFGRDGTKRRYNQHEVIPLGAVAMDG